MAFLTEDKLTIPCCASQGATLEQVEGNIKEAIHGYLNLNQTDQQQGTDIILEFSV